MEKEAMRTKEAGCLVGNPLQEIGPMRVPKRILCGPGPVDVAPRVLSAMALPLIGHMDGALYKITDDITKLLQYLWQTQNALTIPVSGTGTAAWEAAVANLTAPGDVHLVCVNGYFGERHCDMAARYGATIKRLDVPWGEAFVPSDVINSIREVRPQVVWMCYAETSTGVRQDVRGVGDACREVGALFMLDTVTGIGGHTLQLDAWGVDAAYACGQKCLSYPPGASPLTLGPRAVAVMTERTKKNGPCKNWYLDLELLQRYLQPAKGAKSVYHHTIPITMLYAMRESLTCIAEEGLEACTQRHKDTAEYFWGLLENEGLELLVSDPSKRLFSLHTVKVPQGVDAAAAMTYMKENFSVEIGGGLGSALAGKVWRIGLMGYNSRKEVALLVVTALTAALRAQGWTPPSNKQQQPQSNGRTPA